MFDWFKKPGTNVVPFPEIKPLTAPDMSQPSNLDDSDPYYYLGTNKSGNVNIKIGYSTLTMTPEGVIELIERLALMIDDYAEVTVKYIEDKQE